jgi:hypothetical protein
VQPPAGLLSQSARGRKLQFLLVDLENYSRSGGDCGQNQAFVFSGFFISLRRVCEPKEKVLG